MEYRICGSQEQARRFARDFLDRHAHGLAERIRRLRDDCHYPEDSPEYRHMTGAADLIDPPGGRL